MDYEKTFATLLNHIVSHVQKRSNSSNLKLPNVYQTLSLYICTLLVKKIKEIVLKYRASINALKQMF